MNTNEEVITANAAGFPTPQDNVFSRIAERYDLLCDLFSFGIHRIWKRRMVRKIISVDANTVLDVANAASKPAIH
jgi:ubiquinone/menaquinone biosynthesis C-methylase UbiE